MKVNLINENYTENYLDNLLKVRGVTDINKYKNPDESCLNNWDLFDNIYEGLDLFHEALSNYYKILLAFF